MTDSGLLAAGSLLVASPRLLDPNFMHSVVLLWQHTEEGSLGVIVNHESGLRLPTVLSDHPLLGRFDLPLLDGGPVGRDSLQFVHRVPQHIPGGVPMVGSLTLGGDIEALAAYLDSHDDAEHDVRFYLGYSGWGQQQLEAELLERSWVTVEPRADAPFLAGGREAIWRAVLGSLGARGEGLAQHPPDPTWN